MQTTTSNKPEYKFNLGLLHLLALPAQLSIHVLLGHTQGISHVAVALE